MVFSSIVFLFYFLPIVLILYFVLPDKYKNSLLFISSIYFYAWGEPVYVWLIIISTIVDFACGKGIGRSREKNRLNLAKMWLLFSIMANLGLLSFFKYGDFIILNLNTLFNLELSILNIPLPIGISFYTFQTMSYTIDVYRDEVSVQDNFISFGSYVSLFPQLIAGPIVRYKTIEKELNNRRVSIEDVGNGISRFIVGLGKKVLIANNIGLIWDMISKSDIANLSALSAWLGILSFGLQIYFDFSAYSDMAIGLGKVFGFNFLENFNYPYMSRSITEFWRRWHISLGTWFKEYVYIPLGGNRGGRIRHLRNIIVVWLLTGIWHGASWNFVLWGVFFGVLLILEKLFLLKILDRIPSNLRRVYTIILVLVSWVIFSFEGLESILYYLQKMFLNTGLMYDELSLYILVTNIPLFIIGIIGATPYPRIWWVKVSDKIKSNWILENGYLVFLLILSIAYLVDQSFNPFLYFRF